MKKLNSFDDLEVYLDTRSW